MSKRVDNLKHQGFRRYSQRIDIPFDVVLTWLRTYHDQKTWILEQRDESIGVYVEGAEQVHKASIAFEEGWKAHEQFIKDILEKGFDKP